MSRASGNITGELGGIRLRAACYGLLGDFRRGMGLLGGGKELVVQAGLQGGQIETLLMDIEADFYQLKTEFSQARRIQEAILHQTSAVLSPVMHAYVLVNIAFLDMVTGAGANDVSCNLNAALTLFQKAHYPRGVSYCHLFRADLRLREGDATGARVEYMRLLSAARNNDDELVCHCLAKLADPTNPMHADTECAQWTVVFLAFALRPLARNPLTIHQALRRLGDVFLRQGADETALRVLTVALDGFTQMDVHQGRAECMGTIGDVYMRREDLCGAKEMWEAARPLFERSEQTTDIAGIDERLKTLGIAQKLKEIPKVELSAPQVNTQESSADTKEKKPAFIPDL
ncbi:hypothetical protein DFH08DRAFT_1034611 [Mycena albidolilacea]|uniref:Uncharacterized protein n=1 Tax=Mycena albidolilacea TaxID=1033008 RepID=A0AAD7EGY5_9AGAR|nr:hypothetical protein DFH08DRAFT_1034611 [Mycena albidolilacea]